jgi:hypothetical protein
MGYVAKIDTQFNVVWSRIIRSTTSSRLQTTKVREMPNGNFALLYFDVSNSGNFYVCTLSPFGQVLGRVMYTSMLCTGSTILDWDLLHDGTGIAIGRCYSNGEAFITRFGSIPTGTTEDLVSAKAFLGQVYPNPAASEAIINYTLSKACRKASIIIKELATSKELKTFTLNKGNTSLKIDLSNLSTGLYLYSLVEDGKPIATKKLAVRR